MRRGKDASTIFGLLFFSLTVSFVVMSAVLVYDKIRTITEDRLQIALVMGVVIIFLSLAFTVVDALRRKIIMDGPVSKILTATEKIANGDFSHRMVISTAYDKYNSYDLIMENINILAEELKKSEFLKVDFISNVSHEIKTPVAVIKSYATLLSRDDITKEEREKYTKTIVTASERLSRLVSDVLMLSRLENSEIHSSACEFNLTEQIIEALLSFEGELDRRGIELITNLEDIRISSYSSYLEIIWNNLISNAIKFNRDNGKITVSLTSFGDYVEFKISDTGCGIAQDSGLRIFERFYQGDTSRRSEGNGLGLALVKRVADIVGATIKVNSELGRGTTFIVTIKEETL